MRKKKPLASTIVLLLFLAASAATIYVKRAQANPYLDYGWVSPPKDSIPLEISVSSPKNNTVYTTNEIDFNFNIDTNNTDVHYLLEAYFKPDWMIDNVTVFKQHPINTIFPEFWEHNQTFRDLPDGKYSIYIYARGGGGYAKGLTYYFFNMITTSVINFTVDATPPEVSILSLNNETYKSCNVSLSYTVNEKQSLSIYSLDGQKNVTLYGNTTLTNLPTGEHNVTIYVWDMAGNPGIPETVVFEIAEPEPEPFQTTMVVAPIASVAVISLSLLMYFKKRKK